MPSVFRDILYGELLLPDYLVPFLRIPEFARLRGVGLSNVDSYQFKDLSGSSRWTHGVAVASLALRVGERRGLSPAQRISLALAGLLHDVATPPFGHTAEYVLPDFNHEIETFNLLSGRTSADSAPDFPVFHSELPRFREQSEQLSRVLGIAIDPDEIAAMIVGEGDLGFLISGVLDLDNADNVVRASVHMGLDVDRRLPLALADWLAERTAPPIELENEHEPAVQEWVGYRARMYQEFFESGPEELGRQAFIQHLMRTALRAGLPRHTVVWNTDAGLLDALHSSRHSLGAAGQKLSGLATRYQSLESPAMLLAVPIEDPDVHRVVRLPQAVWWIEQHLGTASFAPMVTVMSRRWGNWDTSLVSPPVAVLYIFHLGSAPGYKQLPDWLRTEIGPPLQGQALIKAMGRVISSRLPEWATSRPWLASKPEIRSDVSVSLSAVGDWSFRKSRNDGFHAYPSTFVHAIPAGLINCLGLKGELLVDPFGGTGQTALEALKYGGAAVSSDINKIASLVARARLTFLPRSERDWLRGLSSEDIKETPTAGPPEFPLREKWFHPTTLMELSLVRGFSLGAADGRTRQFLDACLSAVLTSLTARRGQQHGFFADNTPLATGDSAPPYRDAVDAFLSRIRRGLETLERLYSFFEKDDRDPQEELARARVVRLDARSAGPVDYGLEHQSVAGIITSPPYLGTTDYALGNRLSYYWLFSEDELDRDFRDEMGARRKRFSPAKALEEYLDDLTRFAQRALSLLRPGGYLAMVMGQSTAKAFRDREIPSETDLILKSAGFNLAWDHWRRIHWHRNFGYQRVRQERIAVFVAP